MKWFVQVNLRMILRPHKWFESELLDSLIEFVNLLREEHLVQKFVDVPPLCRQQHAVIGQDAQTGASVTDGLHGIFYLIQTTCQQHNTHKLRPSPNDKKSTFTIIRTHEKNNQIVDMRALTLWREDGRPWVISPRLLNKTKTMWIIVIRTCSKSILNCIKNRWIKSTNAATLTIMPLNKMNPANRRKYA